MKIKNWNKFGKLNESAETFTYEMAQEIVYYYNSDSDENTIKKTLDSILEPEISQVRASSYAYKKRATDFLKSFFDRNSDKESIGIDLYNQVRKEREGFPEIYEIEDLLLDILEAENFFVNFHLTDVRYSISLHKGYENIRVVDMSEYIKYCEVIDNFVKRLSNFRIKIRNTEMDCDLHSRISFEIEIRPNYGK